MGQVSAIKVCTRQFRKVEARHPFEQAVTIINWVCTSGVTLAASRREQGRGV